MIQDFRSLNLRVKYPQSRGFLLGQGRQVEEVKAFQVSLPLGSLSGMTFLICIKPSQITSGLVMEKPKARSWLFTHYAWSPPELLGSRRPERGRVEVGRLQGSVKVIRDNQHG